jgi:hypothetical protein
MKWPLIPGEPFLLGSFGDIFGNPNLAAAPTPSRIAFQARHHPELDAP